MMASGSIRREFKFSLLSPHAVISELDALARVPDADEDSILFQGVIDCYFEESEGLVLVDFKTDFVMPGREHVLAEQYRPQLTAYALALTRITGKPVVERHLYFFRTGADVCI